MQPRTKIEEPVDEESYRKQIQQFLRNMKSFETNPTAAYPGHFERFPKEFLSTGKPKLYYDEIPSTMTLSDGLETHKPSTDAVEILNFEALTELNITPRPTQYDIPTLNVEALLAENASRHLLNLKLENILNVDANYVSNSDIRSIEEPFDNARFFAMKLDLMLACTREIIRLCESPPNDYDLDLKDSLTIERFSNGMIDYGLKRGVVNSYPQLAITYNPPATPTLDVEALLAQHAMRQLAHSISSEFSFEDEVFEYMQDEDIRPNWMPTIDIRSLIIELNSFLEQMIAYLEELNKKQRMIPLITAPQPVMVYNPFFATPILNIAALSTESVLRDIILLSLLVNTPILRCITQSFTPIVILSDHHYSNAPTEQFTPFFHSRQTPVRPTVSTPDSEVDTTHLKYRK